VAGRRRAAGVPRAIVDPLAAQIAKLMADPATRENSPRLRWSAGGSTPDGFAAFIKTESIGGRYVKNSAPSRNDEHHVLRSIFRTERDRCPK